MTKYNPISWEGSYINSSKRYLTASFRPLVLHRTFNLCEFEMAKIMVLEYLYVLVSWKYFITGIIDDLESFLT